MRRKTVFVERTGEPRNPGVLAGILMAASALFVVVTGTVVAWLSYRGASATVRGELEQRLQSAAGLVAALVAEDLGAASGEFTDREPIRNVLEEMRTAYRLENLFVFDRDLRSVVDARRSIPPGKQYSMIQLDPESVRSAWVGEETVSESRRVEGIRFMSAYAPIRVREGSGPVAAVYAETNVSFLLPLLRLRRILVVGTAAAAGIALLNLFLIRKMLASLAAAHEKLAVWRRRSVATRVADEVAHEVRNPLGIIRATADALRRKYDSGRQDVRFRDIDEEVERLAGISSRLTSFEATEESRREKTSLNDLVDEVTRGVAEDRAFHGHEIDVRTDADGLCAVMNRKTMKQVLLNLLINAREAQPEGGGILVRTAAEHMDGTQWAVVSVEDNGQGIRPDEVERCFEPYYSTKELGSGLGLAVVKRIVDSHGGLIRVRSAAGSGTSIDILLPAGTEE